MEVVRPDGSRDAIVRPGSSSLGHVPEKPKWEFDASVAAVFEDMLRRSIPQYDTMRHAVLEVGSSYHQKESAIVDLGASRGDGIAPFVDRFGAWNRFVLIDNSKPMVNVLCDRFRGMIDAKVIRVERCDLREAFPKYEPACLSLAVLTLQFLPINFRQQILSALYERTLPGGALIVVEKVLGEGAPLDNLMVRLYHEMKRANGYSWDEIETKKRSLEGVLVPVTAEWNEQSLRRAGFRHVDCFWRWMNFAAWVAVR